MLYRLPDMMYSAAAVWMTEMGVETVSNRLVGNDTDALKRQQSASFFIAFNVVGIAYQTCKINSVFEFGYHHIRNFESKLSVIVSRLSTLLATVSKPMPFAHRAS